MQYYSAFKKKSSVLAITWINLYYIILSEISQTQKKTNS